MGIFLTAEEEHVQIIVKGKVQGVNFRSAVKKRADELGLTGYAKNEPDGTVRIEAEGKMINLTELARWCKEGPYHENVTEVTAQPGELEHFSAFVIQ